MLEWHMGITVISLEPRRCPQCGRPVALNVTVCECGQGMPLETAAETAPAGTSMGTSPVEAMHPRRPASPGTYVLIGLNVLVFAAMTLTGGSTHIDNLIAFGAMYRPLFLSGEYWRLLTPVFIHIGFVHLAFNMYALLILGGIVEQVYGRTWYLTLYLISGMGGTLASAAFSTSISAGASGAIFGLSGIVLMVGYRYRDRISASFRSAVLRGILPFVVFNLAYGLVNKGIDMYAHLGGMLMGVFLTLVVPPARSKIIEERTVLFSPALLLPLVVVAAAFAFPLRAHLEMKKVVADFKTALALEKEKKYDESIAVYQRAVKRRPDLPSLHNNLAVLYSRRQKLDQAEREARLAVRFGESEAMYHQTLAVVLWNQGKLDESAAEYRRAIQIDSANPELFEALGEIYEQQGRWQEAIAQWQTALRLRPEDPSIEAHLKATVKRNTAKDLAGNK